MPIRHRLRLNCWLVPLILASVAAAGLVAVQAWVGARAARREQATLSASLAEGGRRLAGSTVSDLAALRGVDAGWIGLARLSWRDERFKVDASLGAPDIDASLPLPELVSAVHAPQCWRRDDGDWGVAAPVVGADGLATAVLVGRHVTRVAPAWGAVAGAAGILLALGAALGAYLVRHLYRPVEALQRAAEAAMSGQPAVIDDVSEETSVCASAVHALAARYRSSLAIPARPVED